MKQLVERIKNSGLALDENVLKVDSFITHQVDPELMSLIGKAFAEYFRDDNITKVVTIEASGIAPAIYVAQFLNVPLVFARKSKSLTMNEELLSTEVYSFTKQVTSTVSISKKFLTQGDKALIIDDFLANGQACEGLIELCRQAGAEVAAVGILIEKAFQPGRALLEKKGVSVVSLARIKRLATGEIEFAEEDL